MTDRQIIEEFAIVNWINPEQSTREILNQLMTFSAKIAIDPRVSSDAVALYNLGYSDALAKRPRVWEPVSDTDDPFEAPDKEAAGSTTATDPAKTRQPRLAIRGRRRKTARV